MQWWGWSCAQNKCGSCKLPIGKTFVMNGGDGHTKINLL
jgi:succinate dehydrogenase/fumarate reductase-like Fe-S protein